MRKVINILLIIRRICFDFYDFHEKDIFLGQSRKMTVAAGTKADETAERSRGKRKIRLAPKRTLCSGKMKFIGKRTDYCCHFSTEQTAFPRMQIVNYIYH